MPVARRNAALGGMDWKAGKSIAYICLGASLIGAGTCFVTVYRAQQVVNEIIIQKGAEA